MNTTKQPLPPKRRMASITIKREGIHHFNLPIVEENSHGFLCCIGNGHDSIATEWFAKHSDKVSAVECR